MNLLLISEGILNIYAYCIDDEAFDEVLNRLKRHDRMERDYDYETAIRDYINENESKFELELYIGSFETNEPWNFNDIKINRTLYLHF